MKIGFIGTGMMGLPMAKRLLNANYQLVVYNRTKSKAEELLNKGALWANNPKEVAEQSEVVISMISDTEVLKEISIGNEGIIKGLSTIHIDMSTVSPEMTLQLYYQYKKHQKNFMHSPVLGSVQNVIEGSLLIFVGGDKEVYEKCEYIFKSLGKKIYFFEDIKKAGYLKLLANQFIATMIISLSQGLIIADKAGISIDTVLDVLSESTLNSAMYQIKGKSIKEENYTPRFMTKHLLKDINLIIDAACNLNVELPIMKKVQDLFEEAIKKGFAEEDYSSIYKILKKV